MMRFDIMTLFPDLVEYVLGESVIGRARQSGAISVFTHNIRDYSKDKHHRVDDTPYGGGKGMLMMAPPIYDCYRAVLDETPDISRRHVIYLSPRGPVLTHKKVRELANSYDQIILLCGHYEGVDSRIVDEIVDEEISIGDFVLTGGEIPAMAVADAVCRLVPGVLPDKECFEDESHWDGLLEYPQYSRPAVWHGRAVPPILLSGDHAKVARWRRKQSFLRTRARRPDMYAKLRFDTKEDKKILREIADDDELANAEAVD